MILFKLLLDTIFSFTEMKHEITRIKCQAQPKDEGFEENQAFNQELRKNIKAWHFWRAALIISFHVILSALWITKFYADRSFTAQIIIYVSILAAAGSMRYLFITIIRNILLKREWHFSGSNWLDKTSESIEDALSPNIPDKYEEMLMPLVYLAIGVVGYIVQFLY